jgi:tetratricopeptide (TPR) repeat protein
MLSHKCYFPRFLFAQKFITLLMLIALCAADATLGFAAATDRRKLERAARALRGGEFEIAEQLYREILAEDARDAAARLGLSFALYKQRNLQDSFDHAARVVAQDPTSARAHALLGAAMLASGDFRMSIEEFRTAVALDPQESLAVAGLAMVDFYENRIEECLAGLRRAVALDSNEPDYIFSLAQAAARSERYREAADAYERFLRIAPRTDADRRARITGLIAFLRYISTQGRLYETSGAQRVVLPFEVLNNRPVLFVRVPNSREPLRFVLDSGSGMCVVSEEAARRLNLNAVARGGMARAVGGAGRFEIVYGFLPSISLGEATINNVPIYIRRFYNREEEVDGYIGLSLLSKFIASVDYANRTMTIVRGGEAERERELMRTQSPPTTTINNENAPRAPIVEIPARMTPGGFWSGEVRLQGIERPLNFIIDTGATITVVSNELAERENMNRFASGSRRSRVFGAAGVTENVPVLLLPHVAFGRISRTNVESLVLDMSSVNETAGFEQTGIIGGNILRHFVVTFDSARMVVRLQPNAAQQTETSPTETIAPPTSTP